MVYFGMTLGYLSPPEKKERPNLSAAAAAEREEAQRERERDSELSRGFLTPWHLFY